MEESYKIIQIDKIGKYADFENAILVIVIPVDKIKEYDKLDMMNPDDEEKRMDMNICLVFKNYPGKKEWLYNKEELCDTKKYWVLDLDTCFIPMPCLSIRNKVTETVFRTETFQVKLVKDNLDMVEDLENSITD